MAKKSKSKSPTNFLARIADVGPPTKAAALGARKMPSARKGR